jgi:hypothetical protein
MSAAPAKDFSNWWTTVSVRSLPVAGDALAIVASNAVA